MDNIDDIIDFFSLLSSTEEELIAYKLVQKHIIDICGNFEQSQSLTLEQFLSYFITREAFILEQQNTVQLLSGFSHIYEMAIKLQNNSDPKLHFKALTEFLTTSRMKKSDDKNHVEMGQNIPIKLLHPQKKVNYVERVVRDIDIYPAKICGPNSTLIRRLNPKSNIIDSFKHNGRQILDCQYSKAINISFVLDHFSTKINVYNKQHRIQMSIQSYEESLMGNVVISISWSEEQKRLGVVLRQNFVGFWDQLDNFQFEQFWSAFKPQHIEHQLKIQYISLNDSWITIDQANRINFWDLKTQLRTETIENTIFKNGITNLVEINHLKLVAITSLPNNISFWDFYEHRFLFKIVDDHFKINQILFLKSFQLIFTNGFDDQICCYSLHPDFYDLNKVAQWSVNCMVVMAMEIIEDSAMLVTVDEKCVLKIWDVRDQRCCQTIRSDTKIPIVKLVYLDGQNSLCVITTRLNWFKFDQIPQHNIPIVGIQCLIDLDELNVIVVTKRDIRFINLNNGQVEYILQGIFQPSNDICSAQLINQGRCLLVGSQSGIILLINKNNGDIEKTWNSLHSQEVKSLHFDVQNRIFHTFSSDASIKAILLQDQDKKHKDIALRQVLDIHKGSGNSIYAINLYHGLIATSSRSDQTVILWQLEYYTPFATITLEDQVSVTAFEFLDNYPLVFLGDSLGYIQIIKFQRVKDLIDLQTIGLININTSIETFLMQPQFPKKNSQEYNGSQVEHIHRPTLEKDEELEDEQQETPLKNQKMQKGQQVFQFTMEKIEQQVQMTNQFQTLPSRLYATKTLINQKFQFICADNKGFLKKYNFSQLLQDPRVQKISNAMDQSNFNPFRNYDHNLVDLFQTNTSIRQYTVNQGQIIKEKKSRSPHRMSIIFQVFVEPIYLNKFLVTSIQAHDDFLTQMNYHILSEQKEFIFTSSYDSCIKIWDFVSLQNISTLNLQLPLPSRWNFKIDQQTAKKQTVLKTFLAIRQIHQDPTQYGLNIRQSFKLRLKHLIRKFNEQGEKSIQLQQPYKPTKPFITEVITPEVSSPIIELSVPQLMKNLGSQLILRPPVPSLKRLSQHCKTFHQIDSSRESYIQRKERLQKQNEQEKDLKETNVFLSQDFKKIILNLSNLKEEPPILQSLTQRLDEALSPKVQMTSFYNKRNKTHGSEQSQINEGKQVSSNSLHLPTFSTITSDLKKPFSTYAFQRNYIASGKKITLHSLDSRQIKTETSEILQATPHESRRQQMKQFVKIITNLNEKIKSSKH